MIEKLKFIGAIFFVLAAYVILGELDYQDAIEQEQHYCEMVGSGAWPNFKPEINCKRVADQNNIRGIKL
jgi:hypothetical protein